MNKYRKGRLLVLTGMLAFSTATVLVGSASADKGTIKVGSASADGSKGNDPKISGCVQIDTTSYPDAVTVTYALQPPTGTTVLATAAVGAHTTENANLWYMIQDAVGPAQAGPYHISVTVNSDEGQKSKVFWLSDPWACSP